MIRKVRYIKLGESNSYTERCLNNDEIILGFETGKEEMLNACKANDWKKVEEIYDQKSDHSEGNKKKLTKNTLRQIKDFFEDDGSTVWITFSKKKMYWSMSDSKEYESRPFSEKSGTHIRCVRKMSTPWQCVDKKGVELNVDNLAGHLTMVSGYRGTICTVNNEEYALRRIDGEQSKTYIKGDKSRRELIKAVEEMIKELHPKSFEILVETIFTNTGWRRIGKAGGEMEGIDLLLSRPSLTSSKEEIVAVQIKSTTKQSEYESYVRLLNDAYDNIFYIYHTVENDQEIKESKDSKFKLFNASQLAPMVISAGVLDWLFNQVK